MMTSRRRVDVNLDELDQIIDRGQRAPLSESEGEKLKTVIHAMAERLLQKRSTEKTSAVLPPATDWQASQIPANRLPPVMDAILPLRFVAQIRSPLGTLRSIPATHARSASAEECTARRNQPRW
jgi:hypothetical protein